MLLLHRLGPECNAVSAISPSDLFPRYRLFRSAIARFISAPVSVSSEDQPESYNVHGDSSSVCEYPLQR